MTSAADVLALARAEINYTEQYSNITKYWAEYKPSFQGQPWCAIFCHYCFDHAGAPLPFLYTYVPTLTAHAKRTGRQVFDPQPGDIALYWRGEHTGIVERPMDEDGYFDAIEGNTSPGYAGSQSNGGGVYRKRRHVSDCPDGFYRHPLTSTAAAPEEDEMFTPFPAGRAGYMIVASHSGLLVACPGERSSTGAALITEVGDGGRDNRWSTWGHSDDTFSLVDIDNFAWDVPGGVAKKGAKLQVWPFNGSSAQRFRFKQVSLFRAVIEHASGLVVDVANAGGKDSPLLLFEANGQSNQEFNLVRSV